MTNEFELFKRSMIENNKELFKCVSKADLHNHALLGSNREKFFKAFPQNKLEHFSKSNNIYSLTKFIKNNIIKISTTKIGQLSLFECTILTAIDDGISILEISVDYRLTFEVYNGNLEKYIYDLKNILAKYNKKIKLRFDIGISRNAYKKEHKKIILKMIDSSIFSGIDIFGDELSKPINTFKSIYKYAEKKHLKRKAHVGEFGNAYQVYKAIKVLHLNVVQHGISVVNDKRIMKYAKKKNIQFNVCPISNLMLCRVKDIKQHPIKKMYEHGLKVTINTDDQLIFENSLFDEYMLLYKENVFSIDQLNNIRLNSL